MAVATLPSSPSTESGGACIIGLARLLLLFFLRAGAVGPLPSECSGVPIALAYGQCHAECSSRASIGRAAAN